MFPNEEFENKKKELLEKLNDKETVGYIKQRVMEEIVEYVINHENK